MTDSQLSKPRFRVVIVGGSIAGLTLAHCLLRQQVEFVVLEAHEEIAPQVGASIGIIPNGARILDQLGVFDDIIEATEPLRDAYFWKENGTLITKNNAPKIIHDRHGYPIAFVDRQVALEALYKHLGQSQAHVFTGKKAVQVEHLADGVKVHCADQSVYEGDLVVGADGVRSTVRRQMWDYMESIGLKKEALKERETMTSEYSCVFGISISTPGLIPGTSHRTFGEGWSALTIVGKEGRVFWFLFKKLDQEYSASHIPRFDQTMIDQYVDPYLQKPITDNVPFAEVYKRAITRTLLPLEEASYSRWAIDRWVCIGDAAHKMTPNLGQGGNSAIESAAALANSLASLLQASHESSAAIEELNYCLQSWQEKRRPRVQAIFKSAHSLTRLEALNTLKDKAIAHYLMPHLEHYLVDKSSRTFVGATKIDYLPPPAKSLSGTMPFTDCRSLPDPRIRERALWTLPLLGIFAISKTAVEPMLSLGRCRLVPMLNNGTWTAASGEVLDLNTSLYRNRFFDKLMRPLITCFLPSITGTDPHSRIQMLSFMTDLGPVYGIWLLESYRNAHSWHHVILPMAAGSIFQLVGIWKVAPLYLAAEYFRTPLSTLLAGENRKITCGLTLSLVLSTLAGYHSITYANFFAPTLKLRQWYNALWQAFPLTTPLLQGAILLAGRVLSRPSPKSRDVQHKPQRNELQYIRWASGTFALVSGLTFICGRMTAPRDTSFSSIFIPGLRDTSVPVTSFSACIARFLKYDELISMTSGFVWLALRFRELKQAGAHFSWWRACGAFVGSLFTFGPGATFALGWGWREELLYQAAGES
ncbi:monooxygenase [Aspergillus violaceofuscus CBS 115571]|uniref:Monooxygenase n=1 Tax=Aspergillus violaceofuscus (strain CBS 115571) TaxID=1450538 RepID=A0A2V5HGS8_ASPV1|nr:monooxygenase [Aspergillus violaceofuscus CBS 115571]